MCKNTGVSNEYLYEWRVITRSERSNGGRPDSEEEARQQA